MKPIRPIVTANAGSLTRTTGALALMLGVLGVLAGCASPPSRFYTLSPSGDATHPVAGPSTPNPAWLIELSPIDVPPQVSRNQLVVQNDATQVSVLEQERWASLPGDEIRRALSGDLTQQLNTIDVYGSPHPDSVPVYRVSVNVQRFESWPGSHALLDAVWSVRSLGTQAVMTCRSVLNEPVSGGYDALVEAHRRAVAALAESIASGVRSISAVSAPASASVAAAKPARSAKTAKSAAPPVNIPCPSLVPAAGGTTGGSAG